MLLKQCISVIVSISLLTNQMLFAGSLDLDKSATQKTSLETAPNGVPIVNITTPNAQGLSHNKFTNYNVEQKGLILNNSANVVQTQLAGFIAPNTNLSGSAAKTILNEVTGTNRSLLNGYTEVAGDQADVIIANPNGISINGGGFINTPKVTLSTGKPELLNGQVSGFNVNGGDILIEGDGFNAAANSQVDLYSKVLTLNAKLHAQSLNIVTGENHIASDGTITSNQVTGTGVSLDSSALGGIYAQKITLVGTDKGVGVNLPPEVLASNGAINISSDGKITFQKATASQSITAASTSSDIEINGALIAGENISLSAKETLTNNDVMIAGLRPNGGTNPSAMLYIQTSSLTNNAQINSYGDAIIEASSRIDNAGILNTLGALELSTQTLQSDGTIFSQKELSLIANDTLSKGIISSNANINLETSSLSTTNKIITNHDLFIHTQSFENSGYLNVANMLDLKTASFSNTGTIFSHNTLALLVGSTFTNEGLINAVNRVDIETKGEFTNHRIISSGLLANGETNTNASLNILSSSLNNSGQMNSYGQLNITTSSLSNSGYLNALYSLYALTDTLTNTGTLFSDKDLNLVTNTSLSNKGVINGGTSVIIDAKETLTNDHTIIAGLRVDGSSNADSTLHIQTSTLTNNAQISSKGDMTLDATSTLLNKDTLDAEKALTIQTSTLNNQGDIFSNHDLKVQASQALTNNGTIAAGSKIELTTQGTLNSSHIITAGVHKDGTNNANATLALNASSLSNSGKMNSYGQLNITTSTLNNSGYINASKNIDVLADTLSHTGTFFSNEDLTLSLKNSFTNNGVISGSGDVVVTTKGDLTNNSVIAAGVMEDGSTNENATLSLQASKLTNTAKVSSYGSLDVIASNLINTGYFSAYDALRIKATSLHNYGVLFSGANMNLWVGDLLYNYENANILAIGNLIMAKDATLAKTKRIVNDKATIETIEGDISLYAETFENKTDGLVKGTKLIGTKTLTLSNNQQVDGELVASAAQKLINEGKGQTLTGVTAAYACGRMDDDGCAENEIQYGGISEKQVVVTRAYVIEWDTYDEEYPLFPIHHRQQLYDIKYVSSDDITKELNVQLAKYGLSVSYGRSTFEQIFNLPAMFRYQIPDLQGGEVQRQVTVSSEQEYMISKNDPAKLISGGKLSINANTITNYLSEISSNDDMRLTGDTLNNGSEVLFQVDTRTGQYKYQSGGGGLFHSAKYSWAPLPSTTTYTQSDAAYSLIYSAKNITGNLATVNNIDIKSNQAPLGHSATTNATPNISIKKTDVSVDVPQTDSLSVTPMSPITIDPKTHETSISLPKGTNGLFVLSTNPKSKYLVETNPAFASFSNFIGSDYMLSRLGYNPDATTKRLGDAFYENRLVRDSIFEQTGKRYLTSSINSDTEQFQYLMDNALSLQKELKLTPYVRLSADQIASLTKDIVWMEEREVDGIKVLVPVVYIANAALAKTTDNGARIIAKGDINLNVDTLTNQGDIKADGDIAISASKNIYNEGGLLSSGESMSLIAGLGVYNISSTLDAKSLLVEASTFQSDIDSQGITHTYTNIGSQNSALLSESSAINVKDDVTIKTTKDLSLIGTNLKAGGDVALSSEEGNIIISSKTHTDTYDFTTKNGYNRGTSTHEISSSINANSISMNADTLLVNASDVTAANDMNIKADNIAITSGEDRIYTDSKYERKGGFMGGGKKTADTSDKKEVVSSTLSAKNLNIDTKTLSIQGSKLTAEQANIASEVIELISLKNSDYESHFSDSSGMMTRTILSKGHIKEEVVPALIEVRNQLIINNKDVTNQLQTDNLVKTITSQSGLSVEQIKLVEAYAKSEEWDKHMTSLTGMGGLVVAAIVTVCTMGAGAGIAAGVVQGMNLAAEAATQAAIQTAIEAAVQAMVSQVATALLTAAITGESPNIDASSLIKSAVLSGVLSYTSNFTQLSDYGFEKGTYTTKITQAGVNAGVKTAITGGDFKDNLIGEAGSVAFNAVGHDLYNNSEYKDILPPKSIVQGLVGGALAELQGGDFTAGAISTATSHMVAEYMLDSTLKNLDPNNPPFDVNDPASVEKYSEQLKTQIKAVSSLVGGTVALATNKDLSQKDLDIAQSLSDNVQENNLFAVALAPQLISAMVAAITTGTIYLTKDARNDIIERINNSNDNIIYAKGDKMLSPGEIEILKRNGIDPEELKGGKNTGNRDLYKDKQGNIVIKPKGGKSVDGEETGINLNDLDW